MATSYEEQISRLKKALEEAKRLRAQAEKEREIHLDEIARITEELRGFGVDPEKLDEEIARIKARMNELIREAQGLIPWDLLRSAGKGTNG